MGAVWIPRLRSYGDYLVELAKNGEIDDDTRSSAALLANNAKDDNAIAKEYTQKFTDYYTSQGYTVSRLKGVNVKGGNPGLFAYKDIHLLKRLWNYFANIIEVDSIHYAEEVNGERGLSFTWYDPAYGGKKFSPAIIGNGTKHKYLVYFDNKFPFIHQNIVRINLGVSYSINQGTDISQTMTSEQGSQKQALSIIPRALPRFLPTICIRQHT